MPQMLDTDVVTQERHPHAQYAQHATRMSGAPVMPYAQPGVPAYPLYGLPGQIGQIEEVPFYKKPFVAFLAGAVLVGGAWLYVDVIRPRMQEKKATK